MPPNMSGSPLSLSVTLTPIRKAGDTRTLTLKPGEPCLIGRASKSVLKNLQARPDNALYDCPVISREHAELRAHLWDRPENQVSIIDKGSMHGTRVNGKKLREGQSMALRGGDVIQFGEVVSRGESSHDGIFVTFDKREDFSQQSHTLAAESTPATNKSGVYRYPYTSEEESDYDSEDEGSGDEVMEMSSAKTTPEQAKGVLGSQGQPIDLDQPSKSKRELVEDSLANEASVLVEDSVPVVPRKAAYVDVNSEDEANDDSLLGQGSDVESIGPSRSRALSYDSLHESESEDDVEHPDVEARSDDESDGDESDIDRYSNLDQASEGDHLEADFPSSPEPAKEPSPELRSSGETRPSSGRIAPQSTSQPLQSAFERISNNQPHGFYPGSHEGSRQSSSYVTTSFAHEFGGLPSHYDSYRPPSFTNGGISLPLVDPYPSQSAFYPTASSRWDMPPAVSRPAPVPSYPMSSTGREMFSPPIPPFNPSPFGCADSGRGTSTWAGWNSPTGYMPQSPKLPATGPSTSRISNPDIVEGEAAQVRQESVDPSAGNARMVAETDEALRKSTGTIPEMVREFSVEDFPSSPDISNKYVRAAEGEGRAAKTRALHKFDAALSQMLDDEGAAGKKRKAEEYEPLPERDTSTELLTTIGGTQPAGIEEAAPTPKKAKLSNGAPIAPPTNSKSTGSIAKSAVKYAAAVGFGSAATFAFLVSPASEAMLNYFA